MKDSREHVLVTRGAGFLGSTCASGSWMQAVKYCSLLVFRELPSNDPKQRQLGIRLAQTELGSEPKMPLEESLRRTIDYFVQVL